MRLFTCVFYHILLSVVLLLSPFFLSSREGSFDEQASPLLGCKCRDRGILMAKIHCGWVGLSRSMTMCSKEKTVFYKVFVLP